KGSLGGVTYDTSVFVYKVVVTDDGAGQLIATVTSPEDTTFNNTYEASGSWTPEVTKVLVGRELKAEEFSFRLKDSDDKLLQTKTNALDGKVTFDAIPYTQDDIGETYTYTIVEVVPGHPECGMKYDTATVVTVTVTVKDAGEGKLDIETEYSEDTEFNNSYEPEMIDIHGEKSWDDNNDQDGIRPDSITINLYKKVGDGEVTFVDSQTVKADENGKWAWTFADLHKYDDWVEIEYSVTEEAIPGYTPTIDGYNIENKHEPSKIAIKVTKVWLDNDDEQGIRPDSLTIRLYADDIDTGKTLELTADGNWTGMFSDLDEFKEGVKIVYSVEEEGLDDRYDFDEVEGNEEDGFVITNSLVLSEAVISVWVDKTWDDANNKDGIRPDAITIRLFADGEEIDSMEITKADGWEGAFLELPKYKDGVEIVYTIQEDDVEGYTSEVDGYVVTNTHTPSKITIDVTKSWVDNNNEAGMRPKSVTIKLLANGKATGKTLVLTEDVNWKGTFSDLDEYKDGVKIVYTVQEQDIAGYTAEVTGNADKGFVVRNCPVLGEKDDKVPTTGESKSIYWMLGIGLLVVGAGALLLIILRKKAKPKS
ncbi:MAG TPA: Cna B-type domain-containing protein, partial [Clostridiaceae bacterium]|nr:Cna B-type domain-containing protein [Clostridiaceae bacterium]